MVGLGVRMALGRTSFAWWCDSGDLVFAEIDVLLGSLSG